MWIEALTLGRRFADGSVATTRKRTTKPHSRPYHPAAMHGYSMCLAHPRAQQNARVLGAPMSRPSTSTRRSSTGAALTFGVLGPLEVREGPSLLDVPGRQERALLALLLTAPGRVFAVSAIVTGIWGDKPPPGADKTVQSYVSRLRRALPGTGASVVVTRSPGYVAAVDSTQVDAEQFRTMAAAGRRDLRVGRPEAAAAELRD